ncbi:MAG: dethiobiotin synthase [Elusimicrobia bacterium RIFOXYD2_FULL_34_15]|nr:MAG: dethiobiotin synthase [Elusimicrobia bacterium RIFOXYD2_FULL_34_15]
MNVVFIAGTDTGVGKTTVTGLLARHLIKEGYRVVTQKWVQTGSNGLHTDVDVHLKFMGMKRENFKDYFSFMMPYVFKFASSPHLAASLEKKKININKIKKSLEILSEKFDIVIVEGTGGIMVPLKKKYLMIDIVKELNLPVLLVSANKLGTINHTILTVEALKKRNIKILGIIFNNMHNKDNPKILKDNPEIIKEVTGVKILGVL